MTSLYDTDVQARANKQACLLRAGGTASAYLVLIAAEIQSTGQPSLHGNSWRLPFREQRRRAKRLLEQNPSLDSILADGYGERRPDSGAEDRPAGSDVSSRLSLDHRPGDGLRVAR
jgi:hypothetical protein